MSVIPKPIQASARTAFKHMALKTMALVLGLSNVAFGGTTITVDDVRYTGQNIQVSAVGATSSIGGTMPGYAVGPAGNPGGIYHRAIIPFPRSDFSAIAGLGPLSSASLHFSITGDFAESGETYISEVRLFSIDETDMNSANFDLFASASGDGGDHTVIGTLLLEHGVTGPRSLTFPAGALQALDNAINGTDATIAVAFREYEGNDGIDEFFLGRADVRPPAPFTLQVTAVPEPTTLVLAALALLAHGHRRRRA